MLEIVLLILKIAGMIIAAVLGILIVALGCVLFVPIRYRADFSASDAEDGEKKEIAALLRASWLLWLVRAYASYEDTFRVRIKILFFTLMDTAKEKKVSKKGKKPKKDQKKNKKKEAEETIAGQEKETEKMKIDKETETEKTEIDNKKRADKTAKDKEKASEKAESVGMQKGTAYEDQEGQTGKESKENSGKKKQIFNILQTIRNFCDKLKRIKEKVEKIEELWNADYMARSKVLFGKELLYLLKHIKPQKLKGYVRFGFEDPSMTGYAMAGYGILYPIWMPDLSVEPDFEKEVLDCRIKIRGKVRGCHLLKSGLVLFFSKDIRRVITDVRKL